jgi:hypothetical protein
MTSTPVGSDDVIPSLSLPLARLQTPHVDHVRTTRQGPYSPAVYRPDVRSMSVGLSCCAARDVYSPPLPGVPGARRTSVTVSYGHASDERRRWHLQVFGRRNGTEPI